MTSSMDGLDPTRYLVPGLLLCAAILGLVTAQEDDFSSPIKCFTCAGPSEDGECSDPLDVKQMNTTFKTCENGVCLKYTVYEGHKLQMVRGCSADLNFHLTMIDGVCRTERNGNGYLCMCGKNMCNAAPPAAGRMRFGDGGGGGGPGILLVPVLVSLASAVDSLWPLSSSRHAGGSGWI